MKKANDFNPIKFGKIITAQFKKATKEPAENLKFYLDPDNINQCFILIHNIGGNKDEYTDGEYLVRMVFPNDFPFAPPSFYFMTPNGLYMTEKKVCISIGEYHKDDYRATLGMIGFAKNLISGMIGWKEMGSGINLLRPTANDIIRHAKESHQYNLEKNAAIVEKINDCFNMYSATWKLNLDELEPGYKKRLGF